MANRAAAAPPAGGSSELCALLADALKSHFRLEEELLFAVLDARLAPPVAPATEIVREEHRKIAALLDHASGGRTVRSGVVADAIALARHHLHREEETLFPLAHRLLGAVHREHLGASWTESREVRSLPNQP